ncbi:MAG: ribonuclease P protein component [Candidatus Abyssubacteria bacterium]
MKDLGLPKSRRLKKQSEFRRLYQTGRKASDRYLTVYTCPVEGRGGKVGIVTGKKVGKPVERNRIRRVLREIVRTTHRDAIRHSDLVIIVRPAALELSHHELAQHLLDVLRKSGAD